MGSIFQVKGIIDIFIIIILLIVFLIGFLRGKPIKQLLIFGCYIASFFTLIWVYNEYLIPTILDSIVINGGLSVNDYLLTFPDEIVTIINQLNETIANFGSDFGVELKGLGDKFLDSDYYIALIFGIFNLVSYLLSAITAFIPAIIVGNILYIPVKVFKTKHPKTKDVVDEKTNEIKKVPIKKTILERLLCGLVSAVFALSVVTIFISPVYEAKNTGVNVVLKIKDFDLSSLENIKNSVSSFKDDISGIVDLISEYKNKSSEMNDKIQERIDDLYLNQDRIYNVLLQARDLKSDFISLYSAKESEISASATLTNLANEIRTRTEAVNISLEAEYESTKSFVNDLKDGKNQITDVHNQLVEIESEAKQTSTDFDHTFTDFTSYLDYIDTIMGKTDEISAEVLYFIPDLKIFTFIGKLKLGAFSSTYNFESIDILSEIEALLDDVSATLTTDLNNIATFVENKLNEVRDELKDYTDEFEENIDSLAKDVEDVESTIQESIDKYLNIDEMIENYVTEISTIRDKYYELENSL